MTRKRASCSSYKNLIDNKFTIKALSARSLLIFLIIILTEWWIIIYFLILVRDINDWILYPQASLYLSG